MDEILKRKDTLFKEHFLNLFPQDVSDVAELPNDVLMNIKLHNELKPMVVHTYLCPQKYWEGWKPLIQWHLAAG
jgi:hypothetical protein